MPQPGNWPNPRSGEPRCLTPIRRPHVRLARPNVVTLVAGTALERARDRNYPAKVSNPCEGAPTRFAPIYDTHGNCIPSLCAAGSLEAAIFETTFHDIPVTTRHKTVARTLVQTRAHRRLEVLRELRLVSLRSPDLRRWRAGRDSLIASPPQFYEETARWAEAIHQQFSDVEGLLWTSEQCDPDTAYLFFGDRVKAEDFGIVLARDGLEDPGFLSDARQAGRRSSISITV